MTPKCSIAHLKALITGLLLISILSSCYSYKSLTRKNPVTRDVLLNLEPGKEYAFKLKTGPMLKVYVESIDGEVIGGYLSQDGANGKLEKIAYSEAFGNVITNVEAISVFKTNPYLTSALITVGVLATAFLIWNAAWKGWL